MAGIKYLYKLKDYDPIRLFQYGVNIDGRYYKNNMAMVLGYEADFLQLEAEGTKNYSTLKAICYPYYILKVRVNRIESLPFAIHPDRGLFNVYATVLDTLKGRVFKSSTTSSATLSSKSQKSIQSSLNPAEISFTYVYGPYASPDCGFRIDPSILDSSDNVSLKPGQELIVFLDLQISDYLYDYKNDYINTSLLRIIPIIDGHVKDINNEWSDSYDLEYSVWKQKFLEKVDMLLNGKY